MENVPLLQVVDWTEHYENAKSSKYKHCQYVCQPNKHGGLGISNIMGEPDGAAIYGIWCWLTQIISKHLPPRNGWLTGDGKPDSRPLSARMIANMLRRPTQEVHRCLWVCSSPDVGFLRVVQGSLPACPAPGERPIGDQQDPGEIPPRIPEAPGPLVSRQEPGEILTSASQGSIESSLNKKEREKEPPIIPQGDSSPKQPEEGIQYAEAQLWINGLFGRKKAWSGEEMRLLSDLLPISQEDKDLIDWAFGLPEQHEFNQHTKLKQNVTTLLREFTAETDKIRTVRKRMGLNGLEPHEAEGPAWPPGTLEAAYELFGESITLPERFEELSGERRWQVFQKLKK